MKLFLFNIFFPKKLRTLSDEELMLAYKNSENLNYLAELFQRKTPMLASLSLKYLKNKEDAEDATFELFEVIKRDLLKHDVANINAWLFSVTRNHCYKKLNKAKRNPHSLVEDENILNSFMENQIDDDLSDTLIKEGQLQTLEKAITLLKDDQRVCIELFYLKQISYQNIAETTGIELKKVKSHIQNGKRNLKIIMEEQFSSNE